MGMVFEARMLSADQAAHLRADPDDVDVLLDGDVPTGRSVDLDKAWHGLHWLLTGTAWDTDTPAGQAILGGRDVGEDNGYGPSRLLEPDGVRAVAAALAALDADALAARMDRPAMEAADIYPQIWDEDDVFESYLRPAYEDLRGFYARAAAEGAAVLQSLS